MHSPITMTPRYLGMTLPSLIPRPTASCNGNDVRPTTHTPSRHGRTQAPPLSPRGPRGKLPQPRIAVHPLPNTKKPSVLGIATATRPVLHPGHPRTPSRCGTHPNIVAYPPHDRTLHPGHRPARPSRKPHPLRSPRPSLPHARRRQHRKPAHERGQP